MYKNENDNEDVIEFPQDYILVLVTSIVLICNGIMGVGVLALFRFNAVFWFVYAGFSILGILLYRFHSDVQKGILGLVSMVSSFYAGIFWSNSGYIQFPFATIMTVISMAVLILSFASVCFVTCTWPNYDYD